MVDNIMEQVYNHTQNKPSSHARGITNSELKNKAQELSEEADKIVQDSGLAALKAPAEQLRDAAKKTTSDTDSLHYHAGQLAAGTSDDLETKAKTVIAKFAEVQKEYDTLMKAAGTSGLTGDSRVTAVSSEYKELKAIYDSMLNLTKLKIKANELKEAASQHAAALQTPANNLVQNVKNLRDTDDNAHTNAKNVRDKFNEVQDKFNALPEDQMTNVQAEFNALKGAYSHIGSITFPDLLIPNLNNILRSSCNH